MAEIARGKRFSLLAVKGCAINPGHAHSSRETTSYCIVDRDYIYREVWWNYSRADGRDSRPILNRRADALAKLDEFEARYA